MPRKPKPGQSLAEVNPELAKQWHPTKNGKLTPDDVTLKSGKKVGGNAQKEMIMNGLVLFIIELMVVDVLFVLIEYCQVQ